MRSISGMRSDELAGGAKRRVPIPNKNYIVCKSARLVPGYF